MVDDVEALFALRIVGAADVDERDELASRVVAEEGQDINDVRRRDGQRELAIGENRAAQAGAELVGKVSSKVRSAPRSLLRLQFLDLAFQRLDAFLGLASYQLVEKTVRSQSLFERCLRSFEFRRVAARWNRNAIWPRRGVQSSPHAFHAAAERSCRLAQPSRLIARSCRCGGSSSGAEGCHRGAPRRSAGSRGRRCRPARRDRSRAPPSRNSGSSRRHWRRSPSR